MPSSCVCLYVCHAWYCDETAKPRIMQTMPHNYHLERNLLDKYFDNITVTEFVGKDEFSQMPSFVDELVEIIARLVQHWYSWFVCVCVVGARVGPVTNDSAHVAHDILPGSVSPAFGRESSDRSGHDIRPLRAAAGWCQCRVQRRERGKRCRKFVRCIGKCCEAACKLWLLGLLPARAAVLATSISTDCSG